MRYYYWLKRAWSFWVAALLVGIHVYAALGLGVGVFNREISLIAQLLGGLCILASLDSQLALFKQSSIREMFVGWIKECPKYFKLQILGGGDMLALDIHVRSGRSKDVAAPSDDSEKFDVLFQSVNGLKDEIDLLRKELWSTIDANRDTFDEKIRETTKDITLVDRKLTSMLDGVQLQLFGIYMVVYGSIAGYVV